MMIYLIEVLIWGFAVATAEPQFSEMLHGGEFVLGPYDAKVELGLLPDHYSHMSAQDKKASYSFRRLLELMRGSFPTGIYTLPSLDPYIAGNLDPITLNIPLLRLLCYIFPLDSKTAETILMKFSGNLQFRPAGDPVKLCSDGISDRYGKIDVGQVIISGLQSFNIELLELRLDNLRTDYAFRVPLLNAVVSFRANLALGGLFPISINGRLRAKLENVSVEGALAAVENELPKRHFYSLSTLHALFHADDVRISVDGLNVDKDVLESLESLDLFGASNALEPAMKVINYYVAQEVLQQLDNIIQTFTPEQVKAYLLAR